MIDTVNEKLALMEMEIWEPALPISPGVLGQDDKQQLLWDYPSILWGEAIAIATAVIRSKGQFGKKRIVS